MSFSTPQVFNLQQLVLHQLARQIWNYFSLEPSKGCRTITDYVELITCEEKQLDTVLSLSGAPKLFINLIAEALWLLDQGYKEACSWKSICEQDVPIIFSLQYDAQHFISPAGHFDDLAWAKVFVADEIQDVSDRYKLACHYCFGDVLQNLWHTIESNNVLLTEIKESAWPSGLVALWTFSLEYETTEIPRGIFHHTDFYAYGLQVAVLSGFEHGARFFWEHLSPHGKNKFLTQFQCSDLAFAASRDANGIVFFIYSLLPVAMKLFLATHVNCKNCDSIWHCLFHNTASRELVINEIMSFTFISISSNLYGEILLGITSCMESKISNYQFYEAFKVIWSCVSQWKKERKVLSHIKQSVLPRLASMRAFDLLKMIITPFPHEVKDNILFEFKPNIYFLFFGFDDYEAQLDYIFLFMTDQNPISKMPVLRTDVSAFLDTCVKKDFTSCWSSSIEKEGQRQYEELMECLQGSFEVLQQLLHQVDEMNCLTAASEVPSTFNFIGTD